jgi:hypothetical protein
MSKPISIMSLNKLDVLVGSPQPSLDQSKQILIERKEAKGI